MTRAGAAAPGSSVLAQIRAEHVATLQLAARLERTARALTRDPRPDDLRELDAVLDELIHHRVPQARREERTLHPALVERLGDPVGAAVLAADHHRIEGYAERLRRMRMQGVAGPRAEAALARASHTLAAALRLHLRREDAAIAAYLAAAR